MRPSGMEVLDKAAPYKFVGGTLTSALDLSLCLRVTCIVVIEKPIFLVLVYFILF